ncbi:putative Zinc metalloproteinase nas-4 [Hypsibius exemplaris]|uniref:Metalloendopeptidase n=1 Tax=Hypsibius exemplaris TaxID=2072580 RepID=A0A1W0X1A3_HYPEX|nr:putative Zinc metalloproteinase nas-4 [Hypsibius exemplaris]
MLSRGVVALLFLVSGLASFYYDVDAMVIPQPNEEETVQSQQREPTSSAHQDDDDSQLSGPNADEVGSFVEGDMIYPGGFERHVRAVTNQDYRKWLGAIVPYSIDSYYSSAQRQIIYSAIDEIQSKTCINFVERSTEADYIRIGPGEGCSSYVGRRGGQQVVTLDPWRCLSEVGVVAHELLHVLGFYHEHTRLDRDAYIDVLWNNMEGGREVNFHKRSPGTIDTMGKGYDYNSVMHYSAYAFAVSDRQPTLMPRYPTISLKSLGQRRELSALDVEKVNSYYCDGRGRSKDRISEEPLQPEYSYPKEKPKRQSTTTTPAPTTTVVRRDTVRPRRPSASLQFDSPCDGTFRTKAMLSTLDDNMIIMSSKHFWVVDPHRYLSKALQIRDYYPELPDDIDAAFTWINGHTYFFKGRSYWKYQSHQQLEGYPQDISHGFPGLPDSIDAAFLWTEGKIIFVKDSKYWVLHPTFFNQVRGPYPLPTDYEFPQKIQAGLEWPSVSAMDPDAGSTDVWILADQVLYPIDRTDLRIAPGQRPQKLKDWLRCDLYTTSDRLADPDVLPVVSL